MIRAVLYVCTNIDVDKIAPFSANTHPFGAKEKKLRVNEWLCAACPLKPALTLTLLGCSHATFLYVLFFQIVPEFNKNGHQAERSSCEFVCVCFFYGICRGSCIRQYSIHKEKRDNFL